MKQFKIPPSKDGNARQIETSGESHNLLLFVCLFVLIKHQLSGIDFPKASETIYTETITHIAHQVSQASDLKTNATCETVILVYVSLVYSMRTEMSVEACK